MCGQMSGSPLYTMLLLGMGLRQFSVTPSAIPEIKNICRSVTIAAVRGGRRARDDAWKTPATSKSYLEGRIEESACRNRRDVAVRSRGAEVTSRTTAGSAGHRTTTLTSYSRITEVPRRQRQWREKSNAWFDNEYAFVFASRATCAGSGIAI